MLVIVVSHSIPHIYPQYFYLFTNIGALVGQISMAYAEKVRRMTSYATLSLTPLQVCRLLVGVHSTDHRLPALPPRPILRSQQLHPLAPHWIHPRHGTQALGILDEGPLELEPMEDIPESHIRRILGTRKAQQHP